MDRLFIFGAGGRYGESLDRALQNGGIIGVGSAADRANSRLIDRYSDPNYHGSLPTQMIQWHSMGQ